MILREGNLQFRKTIVLAKVQSAEKIVLAISYCIHISSRKWIWNPYRRRYWWL